MTTKEYIEISNKHPNPNEIGSWHTHYEGEEEDYNKIVEFNKELCEKYPFLLPRNRWDDKVPEDYDYSYTELDATPDGWRLAFGDQMVEEIAEELKKYDFLKDYRIIQIKEKYGTLRWYDNGSPVGKLSEYFEEIITKGDEFPEYDYKTKWLKLDHSEHYMSIFESNSEMSRENIEEYNKEAIHYYRVYNIIEKCKLDDIIYKYEDMSARICINCGKPATKISTGWISPWCDKCAKDINDRMVSIDEYFSEFTKL